MNILVIGNGFDLAHGLPTKYTDFLDWVRDIDKIGERLAWVDEIPLDVEKAGEWLNNEAQPERWRVKYFDELLEKYLKADQWERSRIEKTDQFRDWMAEHNADGHNRFFVEQSIRDALQKVYRTEKMITDSALESVLKAIKDLKSIGELKDRSRVEDFFEGLKESGNNGYKSLDYLLKEIFYLLKENFWISYFEDLTNKNEDTWIDFEKEISKVIQKCSNIMLESRNTLNLPEYFKAYMSKVCINKVYNEKDVINRLEYDLSRFIVLFEIYLNEFVEARIKLSKLKDIEEIKIDRVISFNYTHTFSSLYMQSNHMREEDIDYIHGEAKKDHVLENNNMVLGIDEYLPEDRKDKDIDFIFFKKYYQRIYKNTGSEYKNWIDEIRESQIVTQQRVRKQFPQQIPFVRFEECNKYRIYFFGHSLDVTDKDILRDLILNDNVNTTIFYRNMKQRRELITNLVKVIGQDQLIRRTGGSTKTIEFRQQKG